MQAESFVEYAKNTYGVDVSIDQAMLIRQAFFESYPELEVYYAKVNHNILNYCEQRSIMGRKYRINPKKLINPYARSDYLRAAINFPIQSPGSDYVVSGIVDLVLGHKELRDRVRIGATVHDSVITLVREDENFFDTIYQIKTIMEQSVTAKKLISVDIDIPIVVDVEIGPWGMGISPEEYKEKRG